MMGLFIVRLFMSLMLFAIIGLFTLFIFGCAKTTHIIVPESYPVIKYPFKLELPIKKINKNSSDSEVMKAYVTSLMIDENYIQSTIGDSRSSAQ